MKEQWFEEIAKTILDIKSDILFVIDPSNLVKSTEITKCLREKFDKIVEYESELKLRKLIRKNEKIIIIFSDTQNIPYDLLSHFATVEVDIDVVFPFLNKKALLQFPIDAFQDIYEPYLDFKKNKYERLSEEKTIEFIENVLSSKAIKERNKSFELVDKLEDLLRDKSIDTNTWGHIAKIFGELNYLIDNYDLNVDLEELRNIIRNKFKEYILYCYEDLIYSTNSLIHSNLLGKIFNNYYERIALICFDCMGFEEWNVIKEYLNGSLNLDYIVKYSFSMLPSETSHSGNALFGGFPPKKIKELDFINNIHWKNEGSIFKDFLAKRKDIDKDLIFYQRCINPKDFELSENSLCDYHAMGIVFSFIDHFAHSDLMNKNKLIKNIVFHLKNSNLDKFIDSLLRNKFHLYFISDHGSVFCKGNGINVKRDLVNSRAKRYLISDKKELLEEYKTEDSELVQFKNIIGDDYLLLLSGDKMFAGKNEEGLTHGGISIEEIIVPFIEVKYSDRI